MRSAISTLATACALGIVVVAAQESATPTGDTLATTVRITADVRAEGKPLPRGTYTLRLAPDRPAPAAGELSASQQAVEFVADGRVVAREIAEVMRDDDLTAEGASAQRAKEGVRVEMLKGNEFLRVSVKRGSTRYLVYLPVVQ